MKLLNKIWGIGLLALLLVAVAPQKGIAQDDYISEQEFYDELEPYGTWVYDQQDGNIWVPDVEEDFKPYATRGHWVLTEYGNTWVSDYPWGWATFHYGRWRFDDYYGWVWIPGYEWAPAWVSWRQGDGYYGWAPLMPGISIDLSFGGGYNVPDTYWAFAPEQYINQPNIYNYYVPHNRVVTIINRTTIINNTYRRDNRRYIAGPRIGDIQRVTRHKPQVYAINNARRPGAINVQNNTVNIFRPSVRKSPDARPVRVVDGAAYRRQNPGQNIARRGSGGDAGYNRENAAKLKEVGRNPGSNSNVMRVNGRPDQGNRNGRPDRGNDTQPQNRPAQENSNGQQPGRRGGRPEDRPNVTPPRLNGTSQDEQAQREQQIRQQQRNNEQQQRQREQRGQQADPQQQAQQEQQRQLQQSQRDQQRQQQTDQQRQQQQAEREQRRQQQTDQQRQQQDAEREQRRQQQTDQQRQQQQAEREQRRQQQTDQQRQQQQAQREQQRQQQTDQQRQQQQAEREQRRQQQTDQQRQQQQAQREQQQAQREQQRQQQAQQQQQVQQEQQTQQRQQRRPPQ